MSFPEYEPALSWRANEPVMSSTGETNSGYRAEQTKSGLRDLRTLHLRTLHLAVAVAVETVHIAICDLLNAGIETVLVARAVFGEQLQRRDLGALMQQIGG